MIRPAHPTLRSRGVGPITAASLGKPEPKNSYEGGKRSQTVTSRRENQLTDASVGRSVRRSVHQLQHT